MRKIREVLRLKWGLGVEERDIAQSVHLSRSTVWEYVRRAKEAGLGWPLPEDLDDLVLESMLFSAVPVQGVEKVEPDWPHIHRERKRPGVTLLKLWQEYAATQPEGSAYGYVTFTMKYRDWRGGLDATMRLDHKAGDKLFVDYAGQTLGITDPATGVIRQAQVFVATLAASSYTYCEVTESQTIADWLGSHRRALEFFGGVPKAIVPDNLKAGVTQACFYEPDLNRAYHEFAQHYDVAILPTRVRKPKDKAKVESGVQVVERWILADLRDRQFFSLVEANLSVRTHLGALNNKPFQKLPGCRRTAFEQLDKPALSPLPQHPYTLATWKKAKVNVDYHIEVGGHYYSVPHKLIRQQVDIRMAQHTIEVFHHGIRVALHQRAPDLPRYKGKHTTVSEHMPESHQRQNHWTPERLLAWAKSIGENTGTVFEQIMASRKHPEQGVRSCLGIQRLSKLFGNQRLEAACKRAVHYRSYSYKSIQAILQNGYDHKPLPEAQPKETTTTLNHENVRGADYYKQN
jgi:transposase